MNPQEPSLKMLATGVEALVGAVYIEAGAAQAETVMKKIGIEYMCPLADLGDKKGSAPPCM